MVKDQYKQHPNAKEKKDDSNAPFYQSSWKEVGHPSDKQSDLKFARPSKLNFSMSLLKSPRRKWGYHVATPDELELLNRKSSELRNVARFYKEKLANGKIYYVYKDGESIKTLKTRFGKENFAHLVGISFDRRNAQQILDDISDGKFSQNAILVKNDYSTFEKLEVVDRLANVISSKNSVLSNLSQNSKQAQKLNLNAAIKSFDNSYLLAYRYFNPDVMGPVSLINLSNTRKGYSDYSNVPGKEVLAVLSENPNKMGGYSIGTSSINYDYLHDSKQLVEIVSAMQKLVMQDYMRQKSNNKFSKLSQKKEKHHRER